MFVCLSMESSHVAAKNFLLTKQPRLAWHLRLLPPSSKGQDDKEELLCSTLSCFMFTLPDDLHVRSQIVLPTCEIH